MGQREYVYQSFPCSGYMSPEYAIDGVFSVKSDVYSFGVSVIEIITGKRNRGCDHPDHGLNLIGHVWKKYDEHNLLEVADSVVLESSNQHEVFRAIQIGLLCVQEYQQHRPNMSSMIMMLTSDDALPLNTLVFTWREETVLKQALHKKSLP